MSTLCSWEDVLRFKETYLVILKPNLSSNTQRMDQKIWAIWEPKTYASQSVKKKGIEL